jgi:three-Cys-motif partner protein
MRSSQDELMWRRLQVNFRCGRDSRGALRHMPTDDFHDKPFDEGTLTKLEIFELYCREWLPVFLSSQRHAWSEVHLFDYFAGPGTDCVGQLGSPLRLLKQLDSYRQQGLAGWKRVRIHVHFFDRDEAKITQLEGNIGRHDLRIPGVIFNLRPLSFAAAFESSASPLSNTSAAKLVLIDQSGVDHVSDDVFRKLVQSPTCDFLFFISSSTLYRFRDHPSIKQKIARPDDHYHVHRAAFGYYRDLLKRGERYYLAPFSIKKGSNVYGIIFGSGHPLGIDKFLQVAWKKDVLNGEADFDINRENLRPDQMSFPLDDFRPRKVSAFERELEESLRSGRYRTEADVIRACFDHGVTRQHAKPVLVKLKKQRVIDVRFRVPDIRRLRSPLPIRLRPLNKN